MLATNIDAVCKPLFFTKILISMIHVHVHCKNAYNKHSEVIVHTCTYNKHNYMYKLEHIMY